MSRERTSVKGEKWASDKEFSRPIEGASERKRDSVTHDIIQV